MTYGILNKASKKYFKGFVNDQPVWTSEKSEAWRDTKIFAVAQASLFVSLGIKVQQKPVYV